MPNVRTYSRAFNGGVVTPEFWGRLDDLKYQTGLALCRNFMVLPHGPVTNRPGTRFVAALKYASSRACLIPFTYSTTQTMVLEFGAGYIRFHSQGDTLLTPPTPPAWDLATTYAQGALVSFGGTTYYSRGDGNLDNQPDTSTGFWYALGEAYEIPSPYAAADVFDLHFVQSGDILTLTHPNYPPAELRRYGATDWRLVNINFGTKLEPVTGATVATNPGSPASTATRTYEYQITNVSADGKSESEPVTVSSGPQNLLDSGATNVITWTAPAGAVRFNVYRFSGGLYGFLGTATSGSFTDDGTIIPDTASTPPQSYNPFTSDYPAAVSYFEQRRVFAGTPLLPQTLWASRTGTEADLNFSIPSRADDSLQFKVAARESNTIRHIVPLSSMVLLTSAAEYRVTSVNSDALTPTTISVSAQSYVGANNAQPVVVNNAVLFAAARGGHVRELGFNWQLQGFLSSDLSLRAPQLFDGYDIVQMAYQKAPTPIVWMISTSGELLGMTYVPDQQVTAWHTHTTTNGVFESVCVVAEGSEDRVYVVVRRTINGQTARYVERLGQRLVGQIADAYYVDCGATYAGGPTTSVGGLTWLEGQTVNILGDGAVMPPTVVTDGQVILPHPASVIQVGLPLVADVATLPAGLLDAPGAGQGRPKNVNKLFLRVAASGGVSAGPSVDELTVAKVRTTEPPGSPPSLVTGEIEIVLTPSWGESGQLFVRQSDPLPLTLLALTPEIAVGS
jgi:hypothetical protein